MELVSEPSCEAEPRPAHAPPDLRRSCRPDNRILISLKAKFTLPLSDQPQHVLRCRCAFSAPLERLTGHGHPAHDMVGCMLSAVLVPAVPSVVDTIQQTLRRQSRRNEWAPRVAFTIGIVVRRLPRVPVQYNEPRIISFDDVSHLHQRGYFQIDYVYGNYSAINNGEEDLDYLFNALSRIKFVPASKESIRSLEKVMIKDNVTLLGCAICLEDITVGTEATRLPCSHYFPGDCIAKWLGNSKFCPLCRYEISS